MGSSVVTNIPLWQGMLIMGEACMCSGAWEVSAPPAQFCCSPNTALKRIINNNDDDDDDGKKKNNYKARG